MKNHEEKMEMGVGAARIWNLYSGQDFLGLTKSCQKKMVQFSLGQSHL